MARRRSRAQGRQAGRGRSRDQLRSHATERPSRAVLAHAMAIFDPDGPDELDLPCEEAGSYMFDELRALQHAVERLAREVESAVVFRSTRNAKVMREPFFGALRDVPPSALNRLRWHVRNLRGGR